MSVIRTHATTLVSETNDQTITLRPLTDDDLSYLYRWYADPEVLYWTEGGNDVVRSYDKETVQQIFGGVSRNSHCFLVVVDGTPVGDCWLQPMNYERIQGWYPGKDVRRIDMAIGEKEYWGRGIGTAFVGMLVEFAFEGEAVDVLHCFAEDYNERSRRVWIKNGFRLALTEQLPQPQKGKEQLHFVLTREEYNERRSTEPRAT